MIERLQLPTAKMVMKTGVERLRGSWWRLQGAKAAFSYLLMQPLPHPLSPLHPFLFGERDPEAKIQDVPQCLNTNTIPTAPNPTPISASTLPSCFKEESIFPQKSVPPSMLWIPRLLVFSSILHIWLSFFLCCIVNSPFPGSFPSLFKYFTVSSRKVPPPPSHL